MNSAAPTTTRPGEYSLSRLQWALLALASVALLVMFRGTLAYIWQNWQREEYSHGFLVPVISLLLLWQRRRQLQQMPFTGSWAGVALAVAGIGLWFVGTMAAITTIDAYGLVITIAGVALALLGWKAFRVALPAVALLLLMNPIPAFFFNNLSSFLQLVSSQIGVAVIRMFGISVFLTGNVIDLGTYQLQVVEACSGLRYLFPLITLGVIFASVLRIPLWVRLVVVFSTVPITILMNSFRIGVIGVLVNQYGVAHAEGFLHDFEGWVIFMACLALLVLEIWMLVRLSGDRRPMREIIAIDWPEARPAETAVTQRSLRPQLAAGLAVLAAGVSMALTLPHRTELSPQRAYFSQFPLQLEPWRGRRERMEKQYLDVLQLDDYILADYAADGPAPVNFYVAYYASQRGSGAAHSPASCLPGGGWRMTEFDRHEIPAGASGTGVAVNRVIIEQGEQRQLVYYWFQQRGRNITNEYLVKWYLLWDALTRNRTDGAMVRLITPLPRGEDVQAADARLMGFSRQV
ncbi:MAG TPA: VPLPA-CTERM-specific exosortase XrtD, partial [Steroidobacteraceae bacterium]|nr:VPLPA-CTERM-specific exosortase XrtD [Steroidobacteraceae bacterium]